MIENRRDWFLIINQQSIIPNLPPHTAAPRWDQWTPLSAPDTAPPPPQSYPASRRRPALTTNPESAPQTSQASPLASPAHNIQTRLPDQSLPSKVHSPHPPQ